MEPHAEDDYPLARTLSEEQEAQIATFSDELLNLTSADIEGWRADINDELEDDVDDDLTLEWPQEDWVLGSPPEAPRDEISWPVFPIFVGVAFFIAAGLQKVRDQLRNRKR